MTATRFSSVEMIATFLRVSGDDEFIPGSDPLMGGYGFEFDPDDGLPLAYPGERGALSPVVDVVQTVVIYQREWISL